MESKDLQAAVTSTIEHLSKVVPGPKRADLLQVLAHVTSAALADQSPAVVAGYFMKITNMLDGKFDR